MNAKEAKKYADSFKGITRDEERRLAIITVNQEIKDACERNTYEINMDESDSWRVRSHLDYIINHFKELGYYVEKDSFLNNDYVSTMLHISWNFPQQ